MYQAFREYGFSAYLLIVVAGALLAINVGWPLDKAEQALGSLVLLSCWGLDWLATGSWKPRWRNWRRDSVFFLFNNVISVILPLWLGWLALQWVGDGGLMAQLPLWIEAPIGLLLADFLLYWWHRLQHESGSHRFWRLHRAHHVAKEMYWMVSVLENPINVICSLGLRYGFLFIGGFSSETIFLFAVFSSFVGLFSHVTMPLKAGFLNYWVLTPELHHMHHSIDKDEAKNYALMFPLWDILFGTFYYRPGTEPVAYGIEAEEAFFDNPFTLMLDPLMPFAPELQRRYESPALDD